MPVSKFYELEAAARALPASPHGEVGLRTALTLSRLDEATRRGIRISQRGVWKYATVAEAEAARERFALLCLREAGP
jgi:hypothetical protein